MNGFKWLEGRVKIEEQISNDTSQVVVSHYKEQFSCCVQTKREITFDTYLKTAQVFTDLGSVYRFSHFSLKKLN